jgi:uncharacterized protein YaaQ
LKLVLTIVRDDDAGEVVDALTQQGFYVTRLASTGGFLRLGNTVLISGIEDGELDRILKVIESHTEIHAAPPVSDAGPKASSSRAVVFVLDLQQVVRL